MKKLIIIILVLAAAHLTLVVTNNTYIYTVLKMTVFKGQLSPSIDEYPEFVNDTVRNINGQIQKWQLARDYNSHELGGEYVEAHERLGSVAYLVIRNDSICHEQYWDDFGPKSHSNSFSMAKSIVGALTGIAIEEGYIEGVDQKVCDFFPQYCEGKAADLTIEHLLTMSAGINFDESYINPFSYPGRANYGQDLWELNQKYEVTQNPGEVFSYQSGVSQLLAFVVEEAVGKSLSDYAEEKLWTPMGAKNFALWSKDHEGGHVKAFCCFNSNARDFARFGKLYEHRGVWNGDTLIPPQYVSKSVKPADWLNETNGEPNYRYGYQWWTHLNYKENFDFFYMRGLKGQYVIVIPDKNLMVVRLGRERQKRGKFELPKDVEYWIDFALENYSSSGLSKS